MLHIKKVKPMFTSVITTADVFTEDYTEDGIIVAKAGDVKPWQKVVAVGTSVRDIKEGDLVMVNLANYAVMKYDKDSIHNDLDDNKRLRYAFNYVSIDDENGNPKEHFLFNDRDILYVFEGEEIKEEKSKMKIIVPKAQLIGIS